MLKVQTKPTLYNISNPPPTVGQKRRAIHTEETGNSQPGISIHYASKHLSRDLHLQVLKKCRKEISSATTHLSVQSNVSEEDEQHSQNK